MKRKTDEQIAKMACPNVWEVFGEVEYKEGHLYFFGCVAEGQTPPKGKVLKRRTVNGRRFYLVDRNAKDNGTEGQDRESYSDTQDRESYTVDPNKEGQE